MFSLTEFLVGMLFRSIVRKAPITYDLHLDPDLDEDTYQYRLKLFNDLDQELQRHFGKWDRLNGEVDCGFISHIEGPNVLATDLDGTMLVGLRSIDCIAELPGKLADIFMQMEEFSGMRNMIN